MSIVSVDNIQPIGSGTTVTVNKSVTLESGNTNITGVCTATSFVGSGANLTNLPSQVTINNASGNRVITSDGGTTLNGEDTLRYDGTNFLIGTNTEAPYSNRNLTVAAGNSGSGTVAIEVRSPTTGTGRLIFSDGTTADDAANQGQVIYDHPNAKLQLGVAANYQNVTVESTGGTGADLHIIDGNLKVASGHGIDFSAQTASSATGTTVTSELLDHYEEGNWLPDVRGSSTAGTATYTSRSGRYVRIGRIVHVYTDVRWSAHTGAGGLEVHGLPFPQTGGYWGHFGFNYNSGHAWTSGRQIYGWANIGGDFIRYWQSDSNGGSGNLPLDSVVGEIHFYGHYLTST